MAQGPKKTASKSIGTIDNLAKALSVTTSELNAIANTPFSERYRKITIDKKAGGSRIVYDATYPVRRIQKKINERIFKLLVEWPNYLFGSLPNTKKTNSSGESSTIRRDYIACAQCHCGAKSILKLDVANFFDNIHIDTVTKIFSGFLKFPEQVSDMLANICCYDDRLIQGALTSSYLASLCMWELEKDLVSTLNRRNLTYTRLVDDITISSKYRKFDFKTAESHVIAMMLKEDLPLNYSKKEILRCGIKPLTVHGLIVDFETPRLNPSEISKIRAAVHNTVKAASINNYRTTSTFREQYNRTLGRVNKLARVKHNKHLILLKKLQTVQPLPSTRDIKYVRFAINWLRNATDKSSERYLKRYNNAVYRNGIISRTFANESSIFKKNLKDLREKNTVKISTNNF